MTQCPECGARNAEGSTFCVRCGRPFPVAAPVVTAAPAPDATRLVDDAAELFAAGRLDDAVAACHAALDLEPELVAARSLLGMVEEERGNPGVALAEYEAVTRLDPSRTVERDRAVRLRAQLSAQTGAPLEFDDPTKTRRRLVPILVAAGVGVVVLVIGAILSGGGRDQTGTPMIADNAMAGGMAEWDGQAEGMPQPDATQSGWPVAAESSPFPPTPIEPTIKDQSAGQPQMPDSGGVSRQGGGGGGAPPAITDIQEIEMPPPTVERTNGSGPLNPPRPVGPAPDRGRIVGSEPTAPAPQPQPQPSRGHIRVWMGDDEEPRTPAPSQPTGPDPGTPPAAPGPTSSLIRPQGTGSAAPASLTGGPRAWTPDNSRGPVAIASAGRASSPRTAVSANRTWTPATSGAGSRALASQGRSSGGATPTARRGSAQANFPAPTTQASRAPAPAASPSAESLRSRAQQAWSSGRHDDARSLYRSAIAGYEREGRSGSNRSAIQSCQRALEALDSGQ